MANNSKIEWTNRTWNCVTGCTKVSQGCANCYAEREWPRLQHSPLYAGRKFTDVAFHDQRLEDPRRWKKPCMIFVNSLSDLFHERVTFEHLVRIFDTMAGCPQHTFQVLTKRPERMRNFLGGCAPAMFPNVWLGVSVEDQATADERIPILLDTPAAVRWISAEPLLGPINILQWMISAAVPGHCVSIDGELLHAPGTCPGASLNCSGKCCSAELDWVVVGGESGPKARPMHPDWLRSLRDKCQLSRVPFFFKQWGEWIPAEQHESLPDRMWKPLDYDSRMLRVGKKKAGCLLDGVEHKAYPTVTP